MNFRRKFGIPESKSTECYYCNKVLNLENKTNVLGVIKYCSTECRRMARSYRLRKTTKNINL